MKARWEKILRDIWDNKKRSLLVIVTLAIGIAAVGVINNTVLMIQRDLFDHFATLNPASVRLYVSPFPKELANDVAAMREVSAAEARRSLAAMQIEADGSQRKLNLVAAPDFTNYTVNRLAVDHGTAVPGLRGVLIERNSAEGLGLKPGDPLTVEMQDGTRYELRVDGIVHDMSTMPYTISGEVTGYITMPTLEWLGEQPYYNQLHLVVGAEDRPGSAERDEVLRVAGVARDRVIEPAGYVVAAVQVPGDPRPSDFWARRQLDGVLLVFQVMSLLAIVLCAGLVVNTISAVLMQQTRQIGIMRSVGATRKQIILLYLQYVSVLSILALLVALPLGMLGAWGLSSVGGSLLNFRVTRVDLPLSVGLVQAALGLLMPLVVTLGPVLSAARLSVYEAIYQSQAAGHSQKGWFENQMARFRLLSPPVMLSLRNTFRNKSRLAFTLATLTIAGAMFMAVFSSYSTIHNQIDEFGRYIAFDASIAIPGGANKYTVEREARRIPQVNIAEGWASANAVLVHPDGSESARVEVIGLPYDSQTIQPRVVAGRWLHAGDSLQVVINEDLLTSETALAVGSQVTLKVNGQERDVQVVGIVSKHMSGSRLYMAYDELARLTGRANQVDMVRVVATPGAFENAQAQTALGERLEKRFEDAQLSESTSSTRNEIFDSMASAFNILLVVLLLVALILAVIGGLGLTGAMGLNVLERTREIGVLRAVGASHASVRQVVVVEGAVVALISWGLSALLSYPVGLALSEAVVRITFGTGASFQYSALGLFAWLATVLLIGLGASLAPARDAVRLTVREVLNYD
ncbi:MAG: FtsX-like permease family protein [Chloroflexota bacterium]